MSGGGTGDLWISAILEEYRALRQEILERIRVQQDTVQFGVTGLALLIGIGLKLQDQLSYALVLTRRRPVAQLLPGVEVVQAPQRRAKDRLPPLPAGRESRCGDRLRESPHAMGAYRPRSQAVPRLSPQVRGSRGRSDPGPHGLCSDLGESTNFS